MMEKPGALFRFGSFSAAGVLSWHSPAGEWVRSFAIITSTPNELCAELRDPHARRVETGRGPAWLGEEPVSVQDLKAMLVPYPSDEMISWLVSTRVGNVKNNDPRLIEPITLH
jgi:putative SOS response-associated peptidase YedK